MEPTRRQLVQMLAAAALSGGAADARAQEGERLSLDDLKGAMVVHGRDLPADQAQHLRRALERALEQVERVRAFDLDEAFGLPLVFSPTARRVE